MAKIKGERKSNDSKGKLFINLGQRDVKGNRSRRAIVKLYGLISILIITLGLIAIIEYANRTLPSASQSHFAPFKQGTSTQEATSVKTIASKKTNVVTKRQDFISSDPTPNSSCTGISESSLSSSNLGNAPPTPVLNSCSESTPAGLASSLSSKSSSYSLSQPEFIKIARNIVVGDGVPIIYAEEPFTATIYNGTLYNATVINCVTYNASNEWPCLTAAEMESIIPSCSLTCTQVALEADDCDIDDFLCHCSAEQMAKLDTVWIPCTTSGPDAPCVNEEIGQFANFIHGSLCPYFIDVPSAYNQCSSSSDPKSSPSSSSTVPSSSTISSNSPVSSNSTDPESLSGDDVFFAPVVTTTISIITANTTDPSNSTATPFQSVTTSIPIIFQITSILNSTITGVLKSTSLSVIVTSLPVPSADPASTSTSSTLSTAPAAVVDNPIPSVPLVILSTTTGSNGTPTVTPITITPLNTLAATPSPNTAGVIAFVSNFLSTGSDGTAALPITFLQAQQNPALSVVTGPAGKLFTIATDLLQSQILPTPTITSTPEVGANGSSGSGGGSSGNSKVSGGVKVALLSWPKSKTFLGGYLPVILAKIYNTAWSSFCYQAVDMAPFRNPSISTFFGSGDWQSHLTCVPLFASWALIPFAPDGIYFDTNYGCAKPDLSNPNNPCWPPKMTTNPWILRTLQIFLSLIAAMSCAIIVLWFKKPHGASNDPTSIAAIAAVAGHPQVVADFACPGETSMKQLKKSLKGKKYKLDDWKTTDGSVRYGLVPAPGDDRGKDVAPLRKAKFVFGTNWKERLLYKDAVFLVYILAILAITASYLKDINKSAFAQLFSNSTVGSRIIFAAMAAIASMYFSKIERDTQTLVPYMVLQNLNATPSPTILLRKRTLPITSFFPLLKNRHFIPAAVAFTSLMSEFLVVTFSGLPYRQGQLRSEFMFCGITSLLILILIAVMVVVINIWRRLLPHLPRKPDTVAAVLSYVVGARFCVDFEGIERAEILEQDKKIRTLGKRYGYGGSSDIHLERRWIVDESNDLPNQDT